MTAANEQIVTAYEDLGMSPSDIAADPTFGFEEAAIKAVLMQNSSLYRQEMKCDKRLEFADDQAQDMKEIIVSLARYAEEENVRLKAAIFVYNDKKGRNDVQKVFTGNILNVNVLQINERLQKALAAEKRTLELEKAV